MMNMTKYVITSALLTAAILLSACGGTSPPESEAITSPASTEQPSTPEPPRTTATPDLQAEESGATQSKEATATPELAPSVARLMEDYEDALSVRNQLALGALELEKTPDAISSEQAVNLVLLWQTIKALGEASTSAPEEMEAVQDLIVAGLEPAQIASIAALKLTNADLQAYYVEIGVSEVKTPEPDATPQSGSLRELPQEEREAARATAQAMGTPVGGGSGGDTSKRDVLLDNVLELLTARAAEEA